MIALFYKIFKVAYSGLKNWLSSKEFSGEGKSFVKVTFLGLKVYLLKIAFGDGLSQRLEHPNGEGGCGNTLITSSLLGPRDTKSNRTSSYRYG